MMNGFRLGLVFCMTWLFFVAPAMAAKIYQWKDSAGVVHFTDNKDQVPVQFRNSSTRDLQALTALPSSSKEKAIADPGAAMWQERCASCHFTGLGEKGDLIGLGKVAIDPETRFPAKLDDVTRRFRLAVDGVLSDMPRIKISDTELRQIARYLLKAQK